MELVRRIVSWASSVPVPPLPSDAVPGASETERRALAALGGLAGALAGGRAKAWPLPLREWAAMTTPPPELLAATQRELGGGMDILASVYETLVSGASRRRLGTFFTPPDVVEFMLDRAEQHIGTPAVVVDPGAGVGAFSLAARRRWPEARVIAVDVNVVTLGLLAARTRETIELIHGDFLTWASSADAPTGAPRLWIGNPPYTRHHQLPAETKDDAMRAAGKIITSRRAGLSAYFLATTLLARRPGDVICYLLPGTWVDTSYGEPLRRAVLHSTAGEIEMFGFGTDIDMFPGTRVAAMTLVMGPDDSVRTFSTASARLTATGVQVGRPAHRDRHTGERLGRWVWPRKSIKRAGLLPLGAMVTVRRGVATGANRYFFLTDNERERLPHEATIRALVRLRKVVGESLTTEGHDELGRLGERRWLLVLRDGRLLLDDRIGEWLEAAKAARVHKRYLASHRNPWHAVPVIAPPDVLIGPMSNSRIRAVRNEARVVPSNAIYGLYLDGHSELVGPLTSWLNSAEGQMALKAQARTYGAGLLKLEPSDLSAVLVPAADELLRADSESSAGAALPEPRTTRAGRPRVDDPAEPQPRR